MAYKVEHRHFTVEVLPGSDGPVIEVTFGGLQWMWLTAARAIQFSRALDQLLAEPRPAKTTLGDFRMVVLPVVAGFRVTVDIGQDQSVTRKLSSEDMKRLINSLREAATEIEQA